MLGKKVNREGRSSGVRAFSNASGAERRCGIRGTMLVKKVPKFVKFTPLSDEGRTILDELTTDLIAEGVAVWCGDSLYVELDGNHGDYVAAGLACADCTDIVDWENVVG